MRHSLILAVQCTLAHRQLKPLVCNLLLLLTQRLFLRNKSLELLHDAFFFARQISHLRLNADRILIDALLLLMNRLLTHRRLFFALIDHVFALLHLILFLRNHRLNLLLIVNNALFLHFQLLQFIKHRLSLSHYIGLGEFHQFLLLVNLGEILLQLERILLDGRIFAPLLLLLGHQRRRNGRVFLRQTFLTRCELLLRLSQTFALLVEFFTLSLNISLAFFLRRRDLFTHRRQLINLLLHSATFRFQRLFEFFGSLGFLFSILLLISQHPLLLGDMLMIGAQLL
mmetsp:Transcript_49238/g.81866  ORF Transcript_49238/g.81866 Transcript_49238/m.81866 type:complete len:284 (-) Transcript_49238:1106-1957(-)